MLTPHHQLGSSVSPQQTHPQFALQQWGLHGIQALETGLQGAGAPSPLGLPNLGTLEPIFFKPRHPAPFLEGAPLEGALHHCFAVATPILEHPVYLRRPDLHPPGFLRHRVVKRPVMRSEENRARGVFEMVLEPQPHGDVQMVGGFVQKHQVGFTQQGQHQGQPGALSAGQRNCLTTLEPGQLEHP